MIRWVSCPPLVQVAVLKRISACWVFGNQYHPDRPITQRQPNVFTRFIAEERPQICRENPGIGARQVTVIAAEMYKKLTDNEKAELKMIYTEQHLQKLEAWNSLSEETRSAVKMTWMAKEKGKKVSKKKRVEEWKKAKQTLAEIEDTGKPKYPLNPFFRFASHWQALPENIIFPDGKGKHAALIKAFKELSPADLAEYQKKFTEDLEVYRTQKTEWVRKIRDEGKLHLLLLNRQLKRSDMLELKAKKMIESLDENQ